MDRKRILLLLAIAATVALFFIFDIGGYMTLSSLKANRDALLGLYERHKSGMIAIFIITYIVQTALSLPGAAILSLAGGAVFGAVMGTLYVNIGATVGAALAFMATRYLFRDAVLKKFGSNLVNMNKELEQRGFNYLLFLRLVPVFPFFLINFGAGLTAISLRTFLFGTMIGIIPGSFVYCNAGASLASIGSMSEIASLRVLGSFALLGLFALVPVAYARLRKRKNK